MPVVPGITMRSIDVAVQLPCLQRKTNSYPAYATDRAFMQWVSLVICCPEEWHHHAGKRSKKATLSQPDTAASDVQDQSQDKARRQTCKEAAEESIKRISASVTDMGQLASQLPDDLAVARELYRTASMQSKNAELSIKLRQALQKAALKLAGAIH